MVIRPRRLRKNETIRNMVAETGRSIVGRGDDKLPRRVDIAIASILIGLGHRTVACLRVKYRHGVLGGSRAILANPVHIMHLTIQQHLRRSMTKDRTAVGIMQSKEYLVVMIYTNKLALAIDSESLALAENRHLAVLRLYELAPQRIDKAPLLALAHGSHAIRKGHHVAEPGINQIIALAIDETPRSVNLD